MRPHEPFLLVDPERLRVHTRELCRDADDVDGPPIRAAFRSALLSVHDLSSVHAESLARRLFRRILELAKQLFLFLRDLVRDVDLDLREQIATSTLLRCAPTLDPEGLAARRTRGHIERHGSVHGRDLDVSADSGLRVRDGELDRQVVAASPEQGVRRDGDLDVEVAGSAPGEARLALPGESDLRAVAHPCRDLDLEGAGPALRAGPTALGAGGLHDP